MNSMNESYSNLLWVNVMTAAKNLEKHCHKDSPVY